MSTQLLSKTFLFQAIQFSQTILFQTIQFSLNTVPMSKQSYFKQFSSAWVRSLNIKTGQYK